MLAHAFKGIDYELKATVPGSDDPDFLKASPLGKIPGYRTDDGFLFCDSSVIIAYLEKTNPQNSLYPENANDYARALWLEEYADTKMMEACGALYFQRIVGPKFFQQEPDNERVNDLVDNLVPAVLNYVEGQLADGDWFVGAQISVADLAIATCLINLSHADFNFNDGRWPKLAAFYQRFAALEPVAKQLAIEKQMLESA